MKRILCLILALLMIVLCFAGCKKDNEDVSSDIASSETATNSDFVAPDNYATVVLVSINPQFRLYLDANGIVLAVEAVNEDAKTVSDKIDYKNTDYKAVVKNLVNAANDGGFIKADATIDIKVTEAIDEKLDSNVVLDEIKTSVNDKLDELEIKMEITTSVELKDDQNEDNADTSSAISSSAESASTTSQSTEAPACKHSKTKAKSVSTGSNIIDDSKLDIINHSKVCADCGKNLGTQKHTVKDGKCTVCGQDNFETSNHSLTNAGVSSDYDLSVAKINSNGSLNYDLVVEASWWFANGEFIDEATLKIPEEEMLKKIREKFVMSDAEFKKLKAQGTYDCSLGLQTYSDGYFYCTDPRAGGPGNYSHILKGYKDNKKGTFTVYYEYLKGGPDVEEAEREHLYYYAVEYTYSGASNLTLGVDEYESDCITGWKPVAESLRIKSIKKVSDISGITKIK